MTIITIPYGTGYKWVAAILDDRECKIIWGSFDRVFDTRQEAYMDAKRTLELQRLTRETDRLTKQ